MAKAKAASKKKTTSKVSKYRPSNLSAFVIVLLLVALGTVTVLFLQLANSKS